jgi:TetR/AcrR family transcriptional regulator
MKEENIATEQKIIAAAEEVFLRDGYSGARMQDIADLAGINKALLHYYFRSKDKLFEKIFEEKAKYIFPQMEELFDKGHSFEDLIKAFIERYINVISANPFVPLFIIATLNKPDNQHLIQKMPFHVLQNLMKAYLNDYQAGKVRELNPFHLVISIFAMCAMPFMAKPLLMKFTNSSNDAFNELMQQRIKELHKYVELIIRP